MKQELTLGRALFCSSRHSPTCSQLTSARDISASPGHTIVTLHTAAVAACFSTILVVLRSGRTQAAAAYFALIKRGGKLASRPTAGQSAVTGADYAC